MAYFTCTRLIMAFLCASCLVAPAIGCGRPPSSREPGQDAGSDAATDAATEIEPLRRPTTRLLFGAGPVRNGVVDPTFSTMDYVSWSPYSYSTGTSALVTRLHVPSPGGMPTLRVLLRGNESAVTGLVRSAAGPVEVSIWCGRSEEETVQHPRLSLLGLYVVGQAAADFDVDSATPPIVMGGIEWTRYAAVLDEGPIGWASLRIVHRVEAPLYLNAPVFDAMQPGDPKLGIRRLRATLRPLTQVEQVEQAGFFGQFRDRFGGPGLR